MIASSIRDYEHALFTFDADLNILGEQYNLFASETCKLWDLDTYQWLLKRKFDLLMNPSSIVPW